MRHFTNTLKQKSFQEIQISFPKCIECRLISEKLVMNAKSINPSSANPTKWSSTLKQFVRKLPKNFLNVFDHFVGLALKGLNTRSCPSFVSQGFSLGSRFSFNCVYRLMSASCAVLKI